jgi:hypothetical protein
LSAPPALDADGRGGRTLGGARYLLIRPETLVGLQKAVEGALGERAAACITAGGRAGGAKAAATFGRSCTVVETACAAMGAPVCRFVAS